MIEIDIFRQVLGQVCGIEGGVTKQMNKRIPSVKNQGEIVNILLKIKIVFAHKTNTYRPVICS